MRHAYPGILDEALQWRPTYLLAMSTRGYNFRSLLGLIYRCRLHGRNVSPRSVHGSMTAELGYHHSGPPALRFFSTRRSGPWKKLDANAETSDKFVPSATGPASPRFSLPLWARWVLGSLLSLLPPFWKHKWEQLKRIEGEAEIVVDGVEKVAEVAEKVATMAEKVSTDVAENLPEHGKLQEAALVVERVSKEAAHDAQLTKDFIRKVDELKHDFDDLEKMLKPAIEEPVPRKSEGK